MQKTTEQTQEKAWYEYGEAMKLNAEIQFALRASKRARESML
jgi:hypothetical protein